MPPSIGDRLLEHGVLGIVTLIALYVAAYFARKREVEQREYAEKLLAMQKEHAAVVAALQEQRLQGMEKMTGALINATTAMTKQAETGDETNVLLRSIANDYQNRHRGPPR